MARLTKMLRKYVSWMKPTQSKNREQDIEYSVTFCKLFLCGFFVKVCKLSPYKT